MHTSILASEPATSRKTTESIGGNNVIWTLKGKLEFWKTICHHYHDTFQILKRFSDKISCDINECDFLILYDEMCQNKVDLHNSVKQCNLKAVTK